MERLKKETTNRYIWSDGIGSGAYPAVNRYASKAGMQTEEIYRQRHMRRQEITEAERGWQKYAWAKYVTKQRARGNRPAGSLLRQGDGAKHCAR